MLNSNSIFSCIKEESFKLRLEGGGEREEPDEERDSDLPTKLI